MPCFCKADEYPKYIKLHLSSDAPVDHGGSGIGRLSHIALSAKQSMVSGSLIDREEQAEEQVAQEAMVSRKARGRWWLPCQRLLAFGPFP
jgi:hypothetical protein